MSTNIVEELGTDEVFVYVNVETDSNGYIIGWSEATEEDGYILSQSEFNRFSETNGNLYRIDGNTLVYDDSFNALLYNRMLQTAREFKRQALSKVCEDQIINNFYNAITGKLVNYGYDIIDQQNWDSQYEAVKLAKDGSEFVKAQFAQLGYPTGMVAIKGRGNVPYNLISYDQYIQFWLEGKAWVSYNRVVKYYPLLEQIEAATTVEEVEAVAWGE